MLNEFKFETCLKLAARIGLTLQLTILEKIWRNQSKNQNIAQWLIFLILKHVETRNKKNLIEIETVERSKEVRIAMENLQIETVSSKSPKTKKFRKKKKSGFAWGSRKNFQSKFFIYLMTNNDVGLSEIVQQFFQGLDFETLLHCRLVCKAWYRFLNQFPSFWMDSLTEAREKFLYEPRNYMKRWRILQCSVQPIIVF